MIVLGSLFFGQFSVIVPKLVCFRNCVPEPVFWMLPLLSSLTKIGVFVALQTHYEDVSLRNLGVPFVRRLERQEKWRLHKKRSFGLLTPKQPFRDRCWFFSKEYKLSFPGSAETPIFIVCLGFLGVAQFKGQVVKKTCLDKKAKTLEISVIIEEHRLVCVCVTFFFWSG